MGQLTPQQQADLRNNGRPQPVGRGQTPGPNISATGSPRGAEYQQPPAPTTAPSLLQSAAPAANPNNPANAPPPVVPPPVPPPAPVQPISLQGGQVSYNPTTAPFGMDMSAPGYQQQMWDRNQGMWFESPSLDFVDKQLPQFQDPWQGELTNTDLLSTIANPGAGQQHWAGVSGKSNTPVENQMAAGYQGGNNALTAFNRTGNAMPGSLQPQFDAYYDRMKQKVMSDVNSQSAARGSYGSNASLNNSIGAGLDVEANRAKAATDFSLDDSANQRNWLDSYGNQGRAADQTGLEAFGANKDAAQFGLDKTKAYSDMAFRAEDTEFNKNKALSDIAFGIDDDKAARLGAGISTALSSHQGHRGQLNDAFGAAGDVDTERSGHINTLYDQTAGMGSDVQDFMAENYDALLGGDKEMSDDEIQTMVARAADARGWDQQQQDRVTRDVTEFIKAAKQSQKPSE